MNDRILELAEQTSLELFNDTAHHRLLKGFAEKFAELIVRECAKEAFEFWCNQLDCNEDSAQSHIKKHFGVE